MLLVIKLEMSNVLSSLNNSSAGYDEHPLFVVKSCIDGLFEPITYMVNEPLRVGICPSELKIAKVVPVFKSGDPSLQSTQQAIITLFDNITKSLDNGNIAISIFINVYSLFIVLC